jgi:hypothetical protein
MSPLSALHIMRALRRDVEESEIWTGRQPRVVAVVAAPATRARWLFCLPMNPFGRSQEIPGAFARPMGVEKAVQADAMQNKIINLRSIILALVPPPLERPKPLRRIP